MRLICLNLDSQHYHRPTIRHLMSEEFNDYPKIYYYSRRIQFNLEISELSEVLQKDILNIIFYVKIALFGQIWRMYPIIIGKNAAIFLYSSIASVK